MGTITEFVKETFQQSTPQEFIPITNKEDLVKRLADDLAGENYISPEIGRV